MCQSLLIYISDKYHNGGRDEEEGKGCLFLLKSIKKQKRKKETKKIYVCIPISKGIWIIHMPQLCKQNSDYHNNKIMD